MNYYRLVKEEKDERDEKASGVMMIASDIVVLADFVKVSKICFQNCVVL